MSAFADFDETGFLALEPAGKALRRADLRLAFMKMRTAERLTLTFNPEILQEIGGPRYDIAWNSQKRLLLVKSGPQARFEAHATIRNVSRRIIVPVPAGLHFSEAECEPEFYVDAIGKRLLIEVPAEFGCRLALPAPAAPALLPATTFPRSISGQSFTPQEASIIECLYRRVKVSRGTLLTMIHDPATGEDEHDVGRVDRIIVGMRPKLRAAGLAILPAGDNELRMDSAAKGIVREALVQLGAET